jgi:hypothetical protein
VTALTPPRAPDPGVRRRLALAVAEAVDAVGGVRRSGGAATEVATLYPGGRVRGVLLRTDQVEVHIVAGRVPLAEVTDAVHQSVRRILDDAGDQRRVAVRIDDLDLGTLPLRVV